jgi:outer membrane receptor protein involved in Fe transport
MRVLLSRHLLALIVFTALAVALASGQGIVTGSISGTVADQSGALVGGATVRAVQVETNRPFTAVSSNAGVISLPSLPPGTYNVTIEAKDFAAYRANGVLVQVGKDTSLGTLQLTVGPTTESVTVEGTAPLVEATTDQVSANFETKQIASVPLGNTYDSFALFAPGVATAGSTGFSNNNGAEISVNGQRSRSNNFQLDGQNNNDNTIGGPSIFFGNQDSIAELQVISNYDAEYGRNLGSVVNYITKAGTNAFHGTAYEFHQNSAFDSLANQEKSPDFTGPNGNPFCAPGQSSTSASPCDKPSVSKFIDNRFGGTVGGPIKKDKIWFFGSGNFERQRTAGSPSASTPATTPTLNGIKQLQAAFPNNPAVAALAQFGPTAVKAGKPTFGNLETRMVSDGTTTVPVEFGSITRFLPALFNDYEATGRVDFQLTPKDRLFARYIFQQNINTNQQFDGALAAAGGDFVDVPGRSQQIGLDYTRTMTNNLLNQVRFSYSRAGFGFEGGAFPNCTRANITSCPPQVFLDASNDVPFGVNEVFPQGRTINVYQVQDNASWVHGQHVIKFGGEYDKQRSPNVGLFGVNGFFEYPNFNALLANQSEFTSVAYGPPILRFKESDAGLYFQDDWRIKENLTLNLGLRWDWYQQASNLLHDQSVAQQTGPNPLWDPKLPLDRTTVAKVPNHYRNFGPVVGFAWTPRILPRLFGNDETVIRGGFRMAYDFAYYNLALNVGGSAPFVNLANFFSGNIPGLPNVTDFTGANVAAALFPLAPKGDPGFAAQTALDPNFRNPYSEQWNLGIQRRIGRKIAAEVRYVGNHTLDNFQTVNGNPALQPLISAGFANLIPAGLTPCTDPTQPGSAAGYVDCSRQNVLEYANSAFSIYHGLQNELRLQNWHGFTGQVSYTFSKTIDNATEVFSTGTGGNTNSFAQNPFNTGAGERGLSGLDYPHVLGLLWTYDLPFATSQQGFLGHVMGGWQINGTYRYTSGQPYTVVESRVNGSLCDPTDWTGSFRDACRPILSNPAAPFTSVGQCTSASAPGCGLMNLATGNPLALNAAHWIVNDPTAAQFFGSPFLGVGRNTARGEPISTANLGVFKNTKVSERLTVQFQAEAFNVLNNQWLGVPNPRVNFVTNGAFGSTRFNQNGGDTFAGNIVTDGIGRRRLQFGLKLIF